MAGFRNDVLYGSNVDFSGNSVPTAQVLSDGQLLIGSSAAPNIKVGTLTAGNGVSITNGPGSITIATPNAGTCFFSAGIQNDTAELTGDGTASDIVFPNVIYQNGSNYDTGNGKFTAPVDGIYMFYTNATLAFVTSSHTYARLAIKTNDAPVTENEIKFNAANMRTDENTITAVMSFITRLNAGQQAWVNVEVRNGTKVIKIQGSFFATYRSVFCGSLLAPL